MNKFFIALLMSQMALWSKEIPITIEYADNSHARSWGLMGREAMDENHGLLIAYDWPTMMSIWMFNVFFDLEIAFLDHKGVIQEIRTLKAYPEMMDPKRPIKTLKDIDLYPPTDPVRVFFTNNSIKSYRPARYGLEMKAGWFSKNGVGVGDRVEFKRGAEKATVIAK